MDQTARNNVQKGYSLLLRVSALLMFTIIFLTFLQVLLRYAFNQPLSWIEEVSRYLFVWIVMLGAAFAFRTGEHINIDITSNIPNEWFRLSIAMLRYVASLIAAVVILYSGSVVALKYKNRYFYTLPDVPAFLLYASMPLCSALMVFFILRKIRDLVRGREACSFSASVRP